MSDELPEGWALAKLGALCTKPQYGWTTSASKNGGDIKLLRTTDISGGRVDWSTVPSCVEVPADLAKYLLAEGDIVVSRAGSVGLSHVLSGHLPRAVFASYLIRFRPRGDVPSAFLRLFLNSPAYWGAVEQEAAGIALQNINASKLGDMDVPVPPVAEQKRIVEKVEALLADVNRARDRLAKVPLILKRFRQSVLAAACSGKLTEEWRNGPGAPCARPRGAVLDGAELGTDVGEDAPELDLPESWTFARVGTVCELLNGDRSKNYPSKEHRVPSGIPFINAGHLVDGRVSYDEMDYITQERFDLLRGGKVREGDVLYCLRGSLGKAAIVSGIERGAIASSLVIARANPALCSPEYLHVFLTSPLGFAMIRKYDNGSAQPNLSAADVARFVIPLPSRAEQEVIMSRVRALFVVSDAIARQLRAASDRCTNLPPAVLARAFSGALVPTEVELARDEGRDYEPASALLARLGADPGTRSPHGAKNVRGRRAK